MVEHEGSSSLFSIFIISIYSLVLIPFTLYKLCSTDDQASQPWVAKGKKKRATLGETLKRVFTRDRLILIGLWLLWLGLLYYISVTSSELRPFDPFEILQIERTATDKEIRKAYRTLSLKYHPDKNPDPKATQYFAEYITKAYRALTDEVSRKNYEKHGHPDGPQGMNLGVALPEWFFTKDKKSAPLMLLALMGGGILLPLGVLSWYMMSSNKYMGPNNIMNETFAYYLHSKLAVKESQGLSRIPETLMCAMEFITLPTPVEHTAPMDELRRAVLRHSSDLKDKKPFWARKGSVVKAHMLLLTHLARDTDSVPPQLRADLKYVLQKTPLLLEEIVKIALIPRPPAAVGWLAPAVAGVEMMQCVTQAVPLHVRKPTGGKASSDFSVALLQLPHVDDEIIRKLKRARITSIKDLQELSPAARTEALTGAGLSVGRADDVATFLSAMPTVHVRVEVAVDGEDEIMETDPVKCTLRVLVTRPSHAALGAAKPAAKGKPVRAYTPNYPAQRRDENWYVFLADQPANAVLCNHRVSLAEAEAVAFADPAAVEEMRAQQLQLQGNGGAAAIAAAPQANGLLTQGAQDKQSSSKALTTAVRRKGQQANGTAANGTADNSDTDSGDDGGASEPEAKGQLIEMVFRAPKAGKTELTLLLMSDCWIGCDLVVPVKFKVLPLTRAAAEGREARTLAKSKQWASDEESEGGADDEPETDGDADGEGEDYDSEESGEEESGDEGDK